MIKIITILINILIIGLFLHSKLLPYQDKLSPHYKKIFDFFHIAFSPIFIFFKNLVKPLNIGLGLAVDMSQIILLIIFLLLLNFL